MAEEFYEEVTKALGTAQQRFESEWNAPSDATGAHLIAAAITLAGARIAWQLFRVERATGS